MNYGDVWTLWMALLVIWCVVLLWWQPWFDSRVTPLRACLIGNLVPLACCLVPFMLYWLTK